jgi:hypothetical protein
MKHSYRSFLLVLFPVFAALTGCAAGSLEAARAVAPVVQSDGSVRITEVVPSLSSPLIAGERVKLTVTVQLSQPTDGAVIALFVQEPAPSNKKIAEDATKVVGSRTGHAVLTTEFIVPSTGSLSIFTPMFVRQDRPSSVADMRVFEVRRP